MHILINATAAPAGAAGETYFGEIVPELLRIDPETRYTLLVTEGQPLAARLPDRVERVMMRAPAHAFGRSLTVQRTLQTLARTRRPDILYNTGNFYTPAVPCRQVCLVENANVFSHRAVEWAVPGRIRNFLLRQMTLRALRHADAVVFPSKNMRDLVLRRTAVRAPDSVIPHGFTPPADESGDIRVKEKFVLCVSSVYPHKNLPRLVRAFRSLVDKTGYAGRLVIIGYAGPSVYYVPLKSAIRETGLDGRVLLLPPVDRRMIATYYKAADSSVLPSIEESFGLPAIEAMALGCPVAAADTALSNTGEPFFNPLPELCGAAAEYFDPFKPDAIANAIAKTLDPRRRTELIAAGLQRATLFTWQKTAASLFRVFQQVHAGRVS